MRHRLQRQAAMLAVLAATVTPVQAENHRRLAHRPLVQSLPRETPYRDPHPRFGVAAPVAVHVVRAYRPRTGNQPLYNEPPQPLR